MSFQPLIYEGIIFGGGGSGDQSDVPTAQFTFLNNTGPANITGFNLPSATVRSFSAQVTVKRGTNYAQYAIDGLQNASGWVLTQSYIGVDCGVAFTITSLGQMQYTSSNTGLGGTIEYRAFAISI